MTQHEIQNITLESLRDWFKKEKWVRITTSGNIAGPCGTSKNKKNPDRCLPAAKARSLTKAQRAATARKKKKAGAKGKTVVKNTKAATVKKENYKGKHQGTNYAWPMSKATKDRKEADKKATVKKETKEAPAGHYFTKSGNLVKGRMSADAKERGARKSDPKDKTRSKVPKVTQYTETANPQDGKAAPYGSGYKKVTKEDIRNFVTGTLHEMQNESKSYTIDLGNIKSDDLWMIASHLKDAAIGGKTGPISDLVAQAADMLENNQTESLNEKDDRCTRIAKSKYDTWPSAYASGAVVRCRRGEIWKKK